MLSGFLTTSGGTELAGGEAGRGYLAPEVGFVKLSPCRKSLGEISCNHLSVSDKLLEDWCLAQLMHSEW